MVSLDTQTKSNNDIVFDIVQKHLDNYKDLPNTKETWDKITKDIIELLGDIVKSPGHVFSVVVDEENQEVAVMINPEAIVKSPGQAFSVVTDGENQEITVTINPEATILVSLEEEQAKGSLGKVGMYGGKFLPVHQGHVNTMIRASTLVDELHIIVSYDPKYEAALCAEAGIIKPIPAAVRARWWKQLTKDMPHVHVHTVYEEQTGNFSDWEKGAQGIKTAVKKPIDVVFSSEHSYTGFFSKLYPEAAHVVVDPKREAYPISATQIRNEGPMKHWDMLPGVVRPYFAKTVVVIGTESCGKSTLVKNLANAYNTRYVEEYGRTFYERIGDEETLVEDYKHIAYEQKFHEKHQLERAHKVLFVDTEATVTQYYANLYLNHQDPVVEAITEDQNYDLWLFLEPDVEWVGDGYRQHGDQIDRVANSRWLKGMLDARGIPYETISGSYNTRLNTAMGLVDNLLNEDV